MQQNNLYITSQGDTWDMISYKVYGDEHYVDILIKANITYKDIVIFSANEKIFIPIRPIKTVIDLPPWKRGNVDE